MSHRFLFSLAFLTILVGCGEATQSLAARTDEPTTRAAMENTDYSNRTEAQWREVLTPQQYHVLREKGTERPFTGEYNDHTQPGTYHCAACGLALFHANTKFHSGCGWPSFYAAAAGDRVKLSADHSFGMVRTEVTCARCGSHLGHVFDDAPDQPTGQRYCINSVSLKFEPDAPATRPTTPQGAAPTTRPAEDQ